MLDYYWTGSRLMTQLEPQALWLERDPVLLPAWSPLTGGPPQPQSHVSQTDEPPLQPQGPLAHWAWNGVLEVILEQPRKRFRPGGLYPPGLTQ